MRLRKTVILCLVGVASTVGTCARTLRGVSYRDVSMVKNDSIVPFGERLTWSTNLADWALLMPNIGIEYDLGDPLKVSSSSVLVNFKYRLDNNRVTGLGDSAKVLRHTRPFSLWSGRVEWRWHFRVSERREQRRGLVKPVLAAVDGIVGTERAAALHNRTVEATLSEHPELFSGRWYVGAYAEYMDYTMRTKIDIVKRDRIKDGWAAVVGLSGGYDFPAFNFNQRHFLQLQTGANIGFMYAPHDLYAMDAATHTPRHTGKGTLYLPMVTELRFALTYRKYDIRRKYWQMEHAVYETNVGQNVEQNRMADTIRQVFSTSVNLFIDVPALDKKGLIASPLSKKDVVQQMREKTGMQLDMGNFLTEGDTIFPIRRLDEYLMTYRIEHAMETFTDTVTYEEVNLKFRVQLAGRTEAEATKQSLLDSIRAYRSRHDGQAPVLLGRARRHANDRTNFERPIPKADVIKLFSDIWGRKIDPAMFREISIRKAAGIYEPIADDGITKATLYAIHIQFHPQVSLDYDTDEALALFKTEFRFDAFGRKMMELVHGHQLTFERPWNGSAKVSQPVTAEEIAAALKKDGINGVTADMVEMLDTEWTFDKRYKANVYLQAGYMAEVLYTVSNAATKREAQAAQANIMVPWIKKKEFPEIHAHRKAEGGFDITEEQVRDMFSRAIGYSFRDYQILDPCVDGNYQTMPDGRLRAVAKVQLHYQTPIMNIPYYVVED